MIYNRVVKGFLLFCATLSLHKIVMTLRTKQLLKLTTLLGLIAIALSLGYAKSRQVAYNKITPLRVEIELSVASPASVRLFYDYGYGFNQQHSQGKRIQKSQDRLIYSISNWKAVKALQLTLESGDVHLRTINVYHQSKVGRVDAANANLANPFVVRSLPELFSATLDSQ